MAVENSLNHPWHVGLFGSCRIETPLKSATAAGDINAIFDPTLGYLHNPLEIMQAKSILEGETYVPKELVDLCSINSPARLKGNLFNKLFSNVDCFVIELSSVRIISYKNLYLQLNRFTDLLIGEGYERKDNGRLFADASFKASVLEKRGSAKKDLFANLLKKAKFYELSEDDLYQAIVDLRSRLDVPVLFVGTVTHDGAGRPIAQRMKLKAAMKKAAVTTRHTGFLDPTDFIDRHGFDTAMADLGHYHADFLPVVGQELVAAINSFCENDSHAGKLRDRRLTRMEMRLKRAAVA